MAPCNVTIVGATGAFGQGLASAFVRGGAASAGWALKIASSRATAAEDPIFLPGLPGVPVLPTSDALAGADLIVLAVPAAALPSFVARHAHQLAGKVLLDVCNPSRRDLAALEAAVVAAHGVSNRSSLSVDGGVNISVDDDTAAVKDNEAAPAGARDAATAFKARWGGDADRSDAAGAGAASPPPPASSALLLQRLLAAEAAAAAAAGAPGRTAAPPPAVVKSMCNLSAYALLHGDALVDSMKSVAASNDREAAMLVKAFGAACGVDVHVGPGLAYAAVLEARQGSFLPHWQVSLWLYAVTTVLTWLYSAVRYCSFGGSPWVNAIMWITNKAIGWTALFGLVYTYGPGVVVCFMQLFRRSSGVRLPRWLHVLMDERKELGLLALAFTIFHLLLSTFLFTPAYYPKLFEPVPSLALAPAGFKADKWWGVAQGSLASAVGAGVSATLQPGGVAYAVNGAPAANATANSTSLLTVAPVLAITLSSRLNWMGEASTLTGILAGFCMCLIAVTSVPCVTPRCNWREWRVLQSWQGWFVVVLSVTHVLILGAKAWPHWRTEWPVIPGTSVHVPTITLLSTIPPLALLAAKLVLLLPPCSVALSRLHAGRWGRRPGADTCPVFLTHAATRAARDWGAPAGAAGAAWE